MPEIKDSPSTKRGGHLKPLIARLLAVTLMGTVMIVLLNFLVWLVFLPFHQWWGFKHQGAMWNQYTWYIYVERRLLPDGWNIFHATGFFWLFVLIVLVLAMVFWFMSGEADGKNINLKMQAQGFLALGVAAAISFGMIWYATWDNLKPQANAYNSATEYVVQDTDKMPAQLKLLTDGARKTNGHCKLVGSADVKSCITEGTLPLNWTARTSSAEAAYMKISKASTGASNTKVMDGSLTYLYSVDKGVWSAVRDGKNQQSLDAVVYWNGSGTTTECRFDGKYAIRGAFNGRRDNNLKDAIAAKYPSRFYDINDVWGFCNGNEPVVVVPMTTQYNVENRTALTYGGDLIIRGDHGKLSMSMLENPKTGTNFEAGELPGPSYPTSLTEKARYFSRWAAGQRNMRRGNFGFDTTDATEQFGNASEYLLQDATTKDLFWVTPLTPRGSDSQQFVAYSITPAGEGHSGKLNTTKIYVLPDNDPRIVNLSDLSARAKQALSSENPGFFSAGGKIVEFLPVDATHWQAYGELGNRVDYRLEIPTDSQVQAEVVPLDGSSAKPSDPGNSGSDKGNAQVGNADCGKKLASLPTKKLAQCLADISEELNGRPFSDKKS